MKKKNTALRFSGGSNSFHVRNTTEIKVIKCKITLDSLDCKNEKQINAYN